MEQLTTISSKSDFVDVRMTISEFLDWKTRTTDNYSGVIFSAHEAGKGLNDIQTMFCCSKSMAFKIAHSEWFRPCLIKSGRHICFDKKKAFELALQNSSLYDLKKCPSK